MAQQQQTAQSSASPSPSKTPKQDTKIYGHDGKMAGKVWHNTTPQFRPPGCYRELILGTCDAGKSTYLKKSIMAEESKYDEIVLIGPNVLDEEHGLLCIVRDTGKVFHAFTEFERDEQEEFYKIMSENKKKLNEESGEKWKTLVVVDDPVGMRHFAMSGNSSSHWNKFCCSSKHYNCSIKIATQGDVSIAPICRKVMNRLVMFGDYGDLKETAKWVQVVPDYKTLGNLLNKYAGQPYHALCIVKYQGYKGLYHFSPDQKVTPILRLP
jgi:hypothetical protein